MGYSPGKSCTCLFLACLLSCAAGPFYAAAQPVIAEMSLPAPSVKLEAFTATPQPGYIELTWTSLSEVRIAGFQVERKMIARSDTSGVASAFSVWETISFIEGKGFPDAEAQYAVADTLNALESTDLLYRLLHVQEDGTTELVEVLKTESPLPLSFSAKTYTRPDNPIVTIEYKLSEKMRVKIYAYNSSGSYSELLVNTIHEAGTHREYFDGSDRQSGLYVCKIVVGKETWIEPMLLIK